VPSRRSGLDQQGRRDRAYAIKGAKGCRDQFQEASGQLTAGGAAGVKPGDYDLVALAMQEPQYRSPGVRELLDAVARAKVPCMSIMNMPPLPYLARIPGIDIKGIRNCYTDPRSGTASIPS